MIKLLTLNTWQERGPWQTRWKLIFKGLRRHQPDIVFFQEVFNRGWAHQIRSRAGYRYMVFPNQPGGLMLLSRYPVLHSEGQVYTTQSPTEDYERYALFAKIKIADRIYGCFNTHLSWKTPETRIRQKQTRELLALIRRKAKGLPVFAAGDFNAPPETPEIEIMRREGRLQDLYQTRRQTDLGLTWDNRNPYAAGSSVRMADRRIDYLWMRDSGQKLRVRRVKVVLDKPLAGVYPSDHYGVLAELITPKGS